MNVLCVLKQNRIYFKRGSTSDWSFDRKTYTWSSRKSSHSWNPADFTMKSGGFHPEIREIRRISPWNPWNPADFTREIRRISPRYHLSNPPKIIKASVSAKTLQFDECKVGTMTRDFMKSAGFHEIRRISCGFHEIQRISCEIERPLARNCNPMFCSPCSDTWTCSTNHDHWHPL